MRHMVGARPPPPPPPPPDPQFQGDRTWSTIPSSNHTRRHMVGVAAPQVRRFKATEHGQPWRVPSTHGVT